MHKRTKIKIKTAFIFTLVLLGNSCELTKPYQSPASPTPLEWKNKNIEQDSKSDSTARSSAIADLDNWWEIFNDCLLNTLENEALQYNYNLKAAFERVLEARAVATIQRSPLYPSVNFSPSYLRNQMLVLSPIALPSSTTATVNTPELNSSKAAASNFNHGLPNNVLRFLNSEYLLPFNFQYEIDLWNKLHNSYYASVYREQAAQEDYYQVLLSITSEVATHYYQLRDLDFQYEIIMKTVEARKKALEINRDRYEAGLLDYLDVSRAEVQVTNAQSDGINIKRLRGVEENIISTLTGLPASEFSISFSPLLTIPPPKIPLDFPSALLYRRPDILSAERSLAAAYAEIGVAYADFFPSLNLNATIGLESPVTNLLFNWQARMWQLGANVMQLVFDAGRTQANVELAKARFREQFNLYQEVIVNAFKEVENALVNLKERANQVKVLENSVKFAQQTYDLSYFRYNRGLVTYLDVTDAERELLQARQNLAIAHGERYVQTVALVKALGGGWSSD